MYEPYQALANAIVASAAKEYIKEYRRVIRAGEEMGGEGRIGEVGEGKEEIRAGRIGEGRKEIREAGEKIRAGRKEIKGTREEAKEIRAGRKEIKGTREEADKRGRNYEIKRLERFFLSAWYTALTDVDGSWLIEQLRKEARGKEKEPRKEARRKEKELRKEARRKEKELRKEARRKEKV